MADKILIAGATGLLGTALAAALARGGVRVAALVREPSRAAPRLPSATLHPWDPATGPAPAAAFEGVTAVVNFMGESIAARRGSDERRRVLRASRVDTTGALVEGLRVSTAKPRVLVHLSGIAFYGDRGDELLTEGSTLGTGCLAELARDWEAEAQKATELGLRVAILRPGVVLSRAGGFLGKLLPPFRLGLGGRAGGGQQWLPWSHEGDLLALIRHALANDAVAGALNAVAPEPVTNA